MGASSYRSSSYSGKGSTSSSRISDVARVPGTMRERNSEKRNKSPMVEMLELLEEVERCRDVVVAKQADLDSARRDLEIAEQKVSKQINNLDSETKARLRRMMGVLNEKEQGQDDNERS